MSTSEPTHVATWNGTSTRDFVDWWAAYRDQIEHAIKRLDGSDEFAFKLGALPPGQRFNQLGPTGWRPPQYIQCAGSAEALAIEVRTVDENDVAHQYAVGRGDPRNGEPDVDVPYGDGHAVTVYPDEVFGSDETIEIFWRYFTTGEVGAPYVLRELEQHWA